MRRRGLPLGHELRGSLPVLGPRAEKPLAAPGGGLHAAGFQAARNHAPDGGEALHLHRQLHHASAAPGNRSPYLKEPSSPSPALISRTLLLGTIPAPGAPPPLVFFSPCFSTFLRVPQPTFSPPCQGGFGSGALPIGVEPRSLLCRAALSPPLSPPRSRERPLSPKCSLAARSCHAEPVPGDALLSSGSSGGKNGI